MVDGRGKSCPHELRVIEVKKLHSRYSNLCVFHTDNPIAKTHLKGELLEVVTCPGTVKNAVQQNTRSGHGTRSLVSVMRSAPANSITHKFDIPSAKLKLKVCGACAKVVGHTAVPSPSPSRIVRRGRTFDVPNPMTQKPTYVSTGTQTSAPVSVPTVVSDIRPRILEFSAYILRH